VYVAFTVGYTLENKLLALVFMIAATAKIGAMFSC